MSIERRKYILIGIALAYAIAALLFPSALYVMGVFFIVLSLVALEKFEYRTFFLIASPIITYPLSLFAILVLRIYLPSMAISLYSLMLIMSIVFAALYGFLLKDFWNWMYPKLKKPLAVSLMILSVCMFVYSLGVLRCVDISGAEKGLTQAEITGCRLLHSYQPKRYYAYEARGVATVMIEAAIAAPILISLILCVQYKKRRANIH